MAEINTDLASDLEENFRQIAIERAKANQGLEPRANGLCWNCDEELKPTYLFCDNDCRDDWELRRQNIKVG